MDLKYIRPMWLVFNHIISLINCIYFSFCALFNPWVFGCGHSSESLPRPFWNHVTCWCFLPVFSTHDMALTFDHRLCTAVMPSKLVDNHPWTLHHGSGFTHRLFANNIEHSLSVMLPLQIFNEKQKHGHLITASVERNVCNKQDRQLETWQCQLVQFEE